MLNSGNLYTPKQVQPPTLNNQSDLLIQSKDSSLYSNQKPIPNEEKIHVFDYLNWASLTGIFLSLWQIAAPFIWVDYGPESILAYVNIFYLIFSLLVLAWARVNYSNIKDKTMQELVSSSENREKYKKNLQIQISYYWLAKFVFVISLLLVLTYAALIVANNLYSDYFDAYQVARQGMDQLSFATKKTTALLFVQTWSSVINIMILLYYAYEMNYLALRPQQLTWIFSLFLTILCIIAIFLIYQGNYLQGYIKVKHDLAEFFQHQDCINTICSAAITATCVAIFTMFMNHNIAKSEEPVPKRYYFPAIIFFLLAGFLFANSLIMLIDIKDGVKQQQLACKPMLRKNSQQFIKEVGCPFKYYKSNVEIGTGPLAKQESIFNLQCEDYDIGIAWEEDIGVNNDDKVNRVGCFNMNCCLIIFQYEGLPFWNFIMLAVLCMVICTYLFSFSLYLGMEQNAMNLKTEEGTFPTTVFYLEIFIAIVCMILIIIFSEQEPPKIQMNKQLEPASVILDLAKSSNLEVFPLEKNPNAQSFPQFVQQKITKGCFLAKEYIKDFQQFKTTNLKDCIEPDCSDQGYQVELQSSDGIFSIPMNFNERDLRLDSYDALDNTRIDENLKDLITQSDSIAFSGTVTGLNKFFDQYLYFCLKRSVIPEPPKPIIGKVLFKSTFPKQRSIKLPKQPQVNPEILKKEKEEGIHLKKSNFEKKIQDVKSKQIHKTIPQHKEFIEKNGDPEWYNVKMHITNGETGENIPGCEIIVIPNVQMCNQETILQYTPSKLIETDETGGAFIYNLLSNKKYTIFYRHDGYLYNCQFIDIDSTQDGTGILRETSLATTFTGRQNVKILLDWNSNLIDLRLCSGFNYNDKLQCQVGYFQVECGAMQYYFQKKSPANVIAIDLAAYNYLISVQYLPNSKDMRKFTQYNELFINEDEKRHLKLLNEYFYNSGASLKVYVKERQFPVAWYDMPKPNSDDLKERHPYWLGLCINGMEGSSSIAKGNINTYWRTAESILAGDEQAYTKRTANDNRFLPQPSICDKYFQQLKQI